MFHFNSALQSLVYKTGVEGDLNLHGSMNRLETSPYNYQMNEVTIIQQ